MEKPPLTSQHSEVEAVTNEREWTAHQRSAIITFWLRDGNLLTTGDIARMTQMTWHGAEYMMEHISIVLPIRKDERGRWCWMSAERM
jgi:hypothetical protein